MKEPPQQVSESVRRLNPHLYSALNSHSVAPTTHPDPSGGIKTPKRIRQSSKPLLNKLETEWGEALKSAYSNPVPQAVGFRLGNGVVYWPDFVSLECCMAWEVKGNQPIQDDSVVKIKVAARLFPGITWILVWKDKVTKDWCTQKVLP